MSWEHTSVAIKPELKKTYKMFLVCFRACRKEENKLPAHYPVVSSKCWRLARAIMSKPKLLLLDEPSMGLAPILVRQIFDIIREINSQGMTILLVEQNARMALSIANRAYVLETGKIVLAGNAAELMESEEIKKAYLGG